MTDKFQNKYRIPSARLKNWDYEWNAAYFVSICTQGRELFFGDVVNGEMILNNLGQIVNAEWIKTPEIRPAMNLVLGTYQIMPNHFHAIVVIGENKYNTDSNDDIPPQQYNERENNNEYKNIFGPQRKNLSSIIRGFKSAVTTEIRKIHADYGWQSRFHDHIIRNEKEYKRIENYIKTNPQKWNCDKFHPTNKEIEK